MDWDRDSLEPCDVAGASSINDGDGLLEVTLPTLPEGAIGWNIYEMPLPAVPPARSPLPVRIGQRAIDRIDHIVNWLIRNRR